MRAKDDHNAEIPKNTQINLNDEVIEHSEDEEFHYSEDRDERVKDTGEVFTPPELVNKMLNELDYDWNQDPLKSGKTFLDPTCGSGNFLVEIAKRGIQPKNIYGVDLMPDNVEITHKRLRKIFLDNGYKLEDINFHMDRNIVQGDALTYHYDFWQHDDLDEW
jgi:site-specific DNA-methyltransferase (adenine-specific)